MIFSNAQGTKHRPPQSPESPVTSWLHGVERGLDLWKRSEAAHGPVVGEEWSTQQVGRKSSNRRLAAALEASDENEDRPFRPGLIVPPNPRSRKRALVRPPIWPRGNSWVGTSPPRRSHRRRVEGFRRSPWHRRPSRRTPTRHRSDSSRNTRALQRRRGCRPAQPLHRPCSLPLGLRRHAGSHRVRPRRRWWPSCRVDEANEEKASVVISRQDRR